MVGNQVFKCFKDCSIGSVRHLVANLLVVCCGRCWRFTATVQIKLSCLQEHNGLRVLAGQTHSKPSSSAMKEMKKGRGNQLEDAVFVLHSLAAEKHFEHRSQSWLTRPSSFLLATMALVRCSARQVCWWIPMSRALQTDQLILPGVWMSRMLISLRCQYMLISVCHVEGSRLQPFSGKRKPLGAVSFSGFCRRCPRAFPWP